MLLRAFTRTVVLASLAATAAAQMSLVSQDRRIEVYASAEGGAPPVENVITVVAPDAGVFTESRSVQAQTPQASGSASASQVSTLAADRITGSGSTGAAATAAFISGASATGDADSSMLVVFDVAQGGTFTMSGSTSVWGWTGSSTFIGLHRGTTAIFSLQHSSAGTMPILESGVLSPGRYTLSVHASSFAYATQFYGNDGATSFQFQLDVEPITTSFCFGDGTGTACPCGNNSPAGGEAGCLNSLGQGGALRATGMPSLANDSLVLHGTQMTNGSALYYQGTLQADGGNGAVFGDGKRCATGSITRLSTNPNVAGTSQYPESAQPSVSVRGGVSAPGTRTYQVWYRNVASFCTQDGFNLTNGVAVEWQP